MGRATAIVETGLLIVILGTVLIVDLYGVHVSFEKHGFVNGLIATFIPPYAVYRAVEPFWHHDVAEVDAKQPFEVHCKEPLPAFTLGRDSHPTAVQEATLCTCIWENLGNWGREASEKIAHGQESEVSKMHMSGFPAQFADSCEICGCKKL
jgi:hypothetical protein